FEPHRLEDITITGNVIRDVGDDGIAVVASPVGNDTTTAWPRRVSVVGNTIYGRAAYDADNAGRGVMVRGASEVTITANTIRSTFASGIHVTHDDNESVSPAYRSRDIIVSNNAIVDAGQVGDNTQPRKGIYVLGADNCTFTANTI